MTKILKLPGLIDTHVHLREPGNNHKEDFESGTKAAVAGGYTVVLDMPNNPKPIITAEALEEKISLAQGRIYCDVGFHFGGPNEGIPEFNEIAHEVFGLKVYMNHTTGPLLVEDRNQLEKIFEAWPKEKVLMVHAEDETLKKAIELATIYQNRLHVCHVSKGSELELIKAARSEGMDITCETALHYLYMVSEDVDRLGNFGRMRPPLGRKEDHDALWEGIRDGSVDTIASDHAPHTKEEKLQETVVNGVPGLETSLPLLLNAVNKGEVTIGKVIEITSTNPRKIFGIPEMEDTYVEVDMDEEWTISNEGLFTKCGWTPFEGMQIKGKVKKTVLRGQTVFESGKISGGPLGKVISPR